MKATLTGIIITLFTAAMVGAEPRMPALIPLPQSMKLKKGVFELTANTRITIDDAAKPEAGQLLGRLRAATGFRLTREAPLNEGLAEGVAGQSARPAIQISLVSNETSGLGLEGYTLSVQTNQIRLVAGSPAGLFYGAQTLLQLLPPEIFSPRKVDGLRWTIPCVEITDSPRFGWRGLLVDVSRHFLTVDELKKFMDVMAMHKLNLLHLHLTDDQGWRLEIKKHPLLTKLGSVRKESPRPGNRKEGDGKPYGPFFYTQDQIRDLVAYARARHITIMPEIEMPGHLLGVLTAHPEYSCTGGPFQVRTRWGIERDVLCIGNTNSIEFMVGILNEVLDLFPSQFIHIGGDEVPRDRWKECPKCQALMKSEGLTREAQLQTWFNHRIETFLASKGRRMIGWDEILEGGLTPGAAVMSWRGIQGGIQAAKAGHDVVMSPKSHLYLDYAQARGPGEPEVIGGLVLLKQVYGYEPVPAQLEADKQKHILGAQGNLWSEYLWTLRDFEYSAYPRAAALAEIDWTPAELRNYENFSQRLRTHVKRLGALQVNYRHLDAATDAAEDLKSVPRK